MKQSLKPILDILPLALFFVFYKWGDMISATSALLISSLVCVSLRWCLFKHIPAMTLFNLALLSTFGGLVIYFNDATFIKVKPTIVYSLFSLILIAATICNKNVISLMTGGALHLEGNKWKKLCLYFACVFALCAVLNEFIWRNCEEQIWVNFKVMVFPLINIFAVIISYLLFFRNTLKTKV
jgi:intracellular septation protein